MMAVHKKYWNCYAFKTGLCDFRLGRVAQYCSELYTIKSASSIMNVVSHSVTHIILLKLNFDLCRKY